MRCLLHLDCSFNGADSISRQLGSVFADRWRELHPDGKYVHRDLAAAPVPPTDAHAYAAGFVPESRHTAEQAAGWTVTARGGQYGSGSPYESFDHQEPHLRSILQYTDALRDLAGRMALHAIDH
ncbi:hypothetical protein [Kribbella sp. HUAS MG21]|uniref:Uncharacterized protein n=1 Tax=Kribbella sp. HUAS MG21 TaxID=3160966 RepID=A0AAU7T541_9ACTN